MAEQQVIEGIWEEVRERHSAELSGHRVQVRVVDRSDTPTPAEEPQYMYFGMFPGGADLTLEDFEAAEFRGDPDDGLAWDK